MKAHGRGTTAAAIRPARGEELDAAARTLAAAFEDYAWTRSAIPEEGYAQRLEELQRLYLGHALQNGLVLVDEGITAVAAFLPPDAAEPEPSVHERIAELHGDRLTGLMGLSLPDVPDGAWTLETVGVDPSRQGTGLGTALTAAGLAVIDERGAQVALQTSDGRNVRLYERLGFAVVETTQVPGGPVVYSMVRAQGS
ncbi:GNAT family N-acetyltransferase [Zhihengliuella sp.]|uniref:GNAT family N-acetyltransferase n=1 Tax=Zhihengliuella sp. TaxID=1954483 RepID=UPI0028114237|nr:GNAT family N-acetyltransferase [Zhihengliuella sp.]